ncbi:MAG: carbohydrate kinase family protein, partial [Candidatus Bathyarchaeia archaeon]
LTSFVGEKPLEAQRKLVDSLSRTRVTLDPGEIYAMRGLASLRRMLRKCFALFPNESELKLLTGKGYKRGSECLLNEGVRIVGVKLGSRGCYVTDGEEAHLVEAYDAEVVDTTGAGDAFCAGFLYGLVRDMGLYECGRLGNLIASHCIRRMGAREGLPRASCLQGI